MTVWGDDANQMPVEILTKTDIYMGLIINGIFTGFAVAIGNYMANKHFIDGIKKMIGNENT